MKRPTSVVELMEKSCMDQMQSEGGGGFDYPLSVRNKWIINRRRYKLFIQHKF
jgi:phage pi2 protein 07